MPKIKILYVSHSPVRAGAEMSLLTLVKHLDRNRFEPVAVFPYAGFVQEEMEKLGIRTYLSPLEWWVRATLGIGARAFARRIWRAVLSVARAAPEDEFKSTALADRVHAIARIIETEKPDIIHSNTSVIWEGALAARLMHVPHVWHIQEILSTNPRLEMIFPLPLAYSLVDSLSTRVVPISSAVKAQLEGIVSSDKLVTINHGVAGQSFDEVPADAASSLRAELALPTDAVLAITMGVLEKEKGHANLVQAAALVRQKGVHIHFLIAGGGSAKAVRELQNKIDDLQLAGTVHLLGFRTDVPRLLQGSDFLIVPSLSEGFSLAAVEAMAAGKPVVATNCGGPADIVVECETGFLVAVNDPASLCAGIVKMASNRAQMKTMGENARRRFNEHFKAEVYAANFEKLYQEIVATKSPVAPTAADRALVESLMEIYPRFQSQEMHGLRALLFRVAQPVRRTARGAQRLTRRWTRSRGQ